MPETIGEIVERAAGSWPRRDAILLDGERLTFDELFARSRAIAAYLGDLGVAPRDRIGLLAQNSLDFLCLALGASLINVETVFFNTKWTSDYLSKRTEPLALKLFFAAEGTTLWDVALRVTQSPDSPRLVALPGHGELATRAGSQEQRTDRSFGVPGDPIFTVFSAGTTGEPRTCRIQHQNLTCKIVPFVDAMSIDRDSRLWLCLPMYQSGFLAPFVAALAIGATTVAMGRWTADTARSLIASEHVTHAYPVYLGRWLPVIYSPAYVPSDFRSLSNICLIGPARVLRRVQKAMPLSTVQTTYGGPEVAGGCSLSAAHESAAVRLGTCGLPFPGHEIRILDPASGALLGPNTVGEVQMRGVGVCSSEAIDEWGPPFTSDGWLRTGDLGSLDDSGSITYLGRLTEMLTVDGKIVPVPTIEAALMEHPDVLLAQVVPIEIAAGLPIASAYIELRPGATLTPPQLFEFCRSSMPREIWPGAITFVSEWPISASKVQKNVLAQMPLGWRATETNLG